MSQSIEDFGAAYQVSARELEVPGLRARAEAEARYKLGRKLIEELTLNGEVYTVKIDRDEWRISDSPFTGGFERELGLCVEYRMTVGQAQSVRMQVYKRPDFSEMAVGPLAFSAAKEFAQRIKRRLRFWR